MKIRLLPVILTFILSGGLLFGGYYAYESMAVDNPVSKSLSGIDGIKSANIDSSRTELKISVMLEPGADLYTAYRQIVKQTMQDAGNRKVGIEILNPSSEQLDRIWSTEMFAVAQAMDNHRYGDIPVVANRLVETYDGLTATTSMDDDNVYITLRLKGKSKYVILPRMSQTMGVWRGEQI